MTSRKRNLSIIGLVLVAARGARHVIATEADGARPRPARRRGAGLRGPPDAAGARGHAAGDRRRDRDDPQAHRRAGRLRARDPARGREPDLDRPARRPERRPRDRAGGHDRPAAVLRLGAQRARATAGPTRPFTGSKALFDAVSWRRSQSPRPRPTDIPPGRPRGGALDGDRRDQRTTTAATTPAKDGYYLFGPDERLIAGPAQDCEELLADFEGVDGPQRSAGRHPEGQRVRRAAGRDPGRHGAGADADQDARRSTQRPAGRGSRCSKVPHGIVVIEAQREPNQPDDVQHFFVLEDDSELSGSDIKNPEQNIDPNTKEPDRHDGVHRRGPQGLREGHQADAQRGSEIILPPGTGQRQQRSSGSRSRSTTRSSRSRRSTSARTPRASTGAPAPQINGIGNLQDTQDLAESLRIGALPIDLKLISQTQVSASLGQQALDQGLLAGAAGLALTLLFLILFYRVLGAVAADDADHLRRLPVRARQADPDHADAAGHRGHDPHARRSPPTPTSSSSSASRRRRARGDRSRPRSPTATRRRCGRSSTRTSSRSASRSSSSRSPRRASRASPSRSASARSSRCSPRCSPPRRSSAR